MRHIFWICCGATLLTAGLWAQAPQNAALAGGASANRQIPETNPFSSDADVQQGSALFQTHCAVCTARMARRSGR